MRIALALALAALCTVGCSSDPFHLDHTSTLLNATRGLVLLPSGRGHGAVLETTCLYNGVVGEILADIDLPTPSERIADTYGEDIVGFSAAGVHRIEGGVYQPELDIAVNGVVDAALTERGPIYLRSQGERCLVGGDTFDTDVDIGACSPSAALAVHPIDRRTWVLDQGLLRLVTPSGLDDDGVPAEHASFDAVHDVLYTAIGTTLTTRDGLAREIDSEELSAPITSLHHRGSADGAVVVLEDHTLELRMRSRGALLSVDIPGAAQVVASDNGTSLSLVTDDEVHNYQLLRGDRSERRPSRQSPTHFSY